MAADTFLNWPYPRLRLMERTLPRQAYRDDKPVVIEGSTWAGARYFQESRIYGEQLAKLTNIPVFKNLHTWEASVEGHIPLQHVEGLGLEDKQRVRHYFGVYADAKEVLPILANLYGYCPYSLDGLIEQGNLRAKTSDLDRAALIEQAYGLQARQWYEKYSKTPIPAVSYLIGGILWPNVEYRETYVALDEVLFVLSAYSLINKGKLDIKLPPKRVRLEVHGGELSCEYIDEKGQRYPAPIPSYSSGKLSEASMVLIRTGTDLKTQSRMRSHVQELVNNTLSDASKATNPTEYVREWLDGVLKDVGKLTHGSDYKDMFTEVITRVASESQTGGVMTAVRQFNSTFGAELWGEVLKTRQAFLAAYLVVAEERGKHLEARINQAITLTKAKQTHIQVVEGFEPYSRQFTRAPSSEEMEGYYKFFQPMPAGVGSQWRMRRHDKTGLPMYYVANEQLSLLEGDANTPSFSDLTGHKALIDLQGLTDEAPLCRAADMVFNHPTKGNLALSLLPRTLSAVMYKLHEHTGGDLNRSIRIQAREILEFMNPRMAKGAQTQAFGKEVDAYEMLEAALLVLEGITYRRGDKNGKGFDQINGLIHIFREGKDKQGRPYYGIQLQPELVQVMQGRSRDMRYMNHNFEIMRSYSNKEVLRNPVAQLALETLACINVRSSGKQELLTPNGLPWTVNALNTHLGIAKGKQAPSDYIKTFLNVLDIQKERGTLKEWRVDGQIQTGADFGKTRIIPVFSDALYNANMQSRTQHEVHRAEEALTNPVAKKGQGRKRTYSPEAPARPRGRPPKTT